MIKMKNGTEVNYTEDFDNFFNELMKTIISESKAEVDKNKTDDLSGEKLNELFLKELMDNSIYVTHQIFEMAKENEDFSKFVVSGFVFNSIIMTISGMRNGDVPDYSSGKDKIH